MNIFKRKKKITPLFDIERQRMVFYWNKFREIENMCNSYIDKNTDEYSKLNKLGWLYFDKYMELFNRGYTEFRYKLGGEE